MVQKLKKDIDSVILFIMESLLLNKALKQDIHYKDTSWLEFWTRNNIAVWEWVAFINCSSEIKKLKWWQEAAQLNGSKF